MTTIEPDVRINGRYPIGKAAEILGISRTTLRKHTEAGYIRCRFSKINKRRFYTGQELVRYWNAQL